MSKVLMKWAVVGVLACMASLAMADEAANDGKSTTAQKFPLQFKVMLGEQYPVCRDYVDMLNATKYMEYPSCERKILPEFSKFKAVQWTEISDIKEVERIAKDGEALFFESHRKLDSAWHKQAWSKLKKKIDSGEVRLQVSNLDMDHDGLDEIVYKGVMIMGSENRFNHCENGNFYFVSDYKIKKENIRDYVLKGYSDLYSSEDADFMLYDGRPFRSLWTGNGVNYDIEIYETYPARVCGINIQ